MKKLLFSVAAVLIATTINAQNKQTQSIPLQSTLVPINFHGVTGNLSDYVEPQGTINEITKTEKLGVHVKGDWKLHQNVNPNALPNGMDPALQQDYAAPALPTKALTQNWDGMGYTGVNPADPSVDVGPNHVVQMINGSSGSYIQVWNKTGTSLMAPVYFDNFMSMAGGAGDPIVLYDERADRWFLSEFSQSGNNLHIAISTTADPTGSYYTYTFNSPGGFPDYPKYSIWENEYVMTANVNTPDIFAMNRADMLAGVATTAQQFSQANFGTIGFQASTPVSLNGTTLPPSGQPALLMRMRDDAWAGSASDALEMWELDIDWVTPGNSSLSQVQTLVTAPHETELCGYTSFSCIPQPSGSNALDPLRELLMNRIHYRNFGTHESIVTAHVTDVDGSDHAGIRWYELRRTGGTGGTWSIYQQGTYAPDADHRWMPSIGISASGAIGMAYSVSSGTTFPSLRYTGRKECDALGVMTEGETTIIAGSASNGSNRWGDYFAMGLDPSDGETFYFTGVYNPATQWQTRIAAFTLPSCSPQVAFGASTFALNEPDADQTNNCLPYAILNVPISIGADPSAVASVTVNVTGGTATNNVDYAIQNNTFSFDNTTLTGNVVIYVYNDDYVEGTETITLDYTLNANGGDAAAGVINQTVTITINDDDLDPLSMTNAATLLTEDFEAGFGAFTTVNPSLDTPFQVGNAAAAGSAAVTFPAANASDFAWINDDACNCNQNDVDLIFPSIDLTNYSGGTLSFSSYFEGKTYQSNTETAEIFVSVGGGAATLVQIVTSNTAWTTQNVDLTPYAGNSNVVFSVKYSDGTGWLYGMGVDDVLVVGQGPINIQTATNAASNMTANLGPNETVHFYDQATSNVMMTLENTSAFDYGCVTVEVDRAGTSALQFNTATAADFLHSKTYTVTPTNANPSGTYNVTVYYEEAEVAGWETATGNSRANAEIVKVAGSNAINDVTPGNAGTFNISSSGSTVGAFYGDVTFTGAFSTGFSGFGVGIYNPGGPVLPTANFTSNITTVCEGSDVTFTDLSGGTPTSWAWTFGDGGTSTAQNPTYTYLSSGTYTVTLTATNASGSDVSTQTALINVTTGITNSQAFDICPGSSVTVGTSTYNSAGTYTDVIPSVGGCDSTVTTTVSMLANSSMSQTIDICQGASYTIAGSTYNSAGTYTDVLPNSAGCDSTVTTTITVSPLPTVTATPSSIGAICSYEDPIALVGSPTGGTFTGPGVSGSTFDPTAAGAGMHTITYSYTDGNGCIGTVSISAEVQDCAGISEETLTGISLHPNPNNGSFIIEGLDEGTEYQVFDERGRLIISAFVHSNEEYVAIPNVQAGIYYIRATKNGKEGGVKFLIAK